MPVKKFSKLFNIFIFSMVCLDMTLYAYMKPDRSFVSKYDFSTEAVLKISDRWRIISKSSPYKKVNF